MCCLHGYCGDPRTGGRTGDREEGYGICVLTCFCGLCSGSLIESKKQSKADSYKGLVEMIQIKFNKGSEKRNFLRVQGGLHGL